MIRFLRSLLDNFLPSLGVLRQFGLEHIRNNKDASAKPDYTERAEPEEIVRMVRKAGAGGEIAESLGPDFVQHDREQRILLLRARAERAGRRNSRGHGDAAR